MCGSNPLDLPTVELFLKANKTFFILDILFGGAPNSEHLHANTGAMLNPIFVNFVDIVLPLDSTEHICYLAHVTLFCSLLLRLYLFYTFSQIFVLLLRLRKLHTPTFCCLFV